MIAFQDSLFGNARDAYGYSLSYYDGDYNATNTAFLNHSKGATPNLTADLFNGNIRGMFTALSDENETALGTHQTNYRYDQLNRIKSMTGYNQTVGQAPVASDYSSNYSFDENGNLKTLQRYAWDGANSVLMDDFEYHYNETINNGNNNRLSGLTDYAGASQFNNVDIDNSITATNYDYDEIGQLIENTDEEIESIEWKVNNKVKAIRRYSWSEKPDLEFEYDAMGNRISKTVIPKDASGNILTNDITTTYYFLDAQGNQLTIYKQQKEINEDAFYDNNLYLSERNIYGSSRIGQEKIGEILASTDINLININTGTQNIVGDKFFEMSNHLGNILEVVTDIKLPVPDGQGGTKYFTADIASFSDFMPFGMEMPNRNGNSGDYRWGFNGMEKDNEVKGTNNSYDFGARIYDPRVGRFLNLDPKAYKYGWMSPYCFAANNPVYLVDENGEGPIVEALKNLLRTEALVARLTGYSVERKMTVQASAGVGGLIGAGGIISQSIVIDPNGNFGIIIDVGVFADLFSSETGIGYKGTAETGNTTTGAAVTATFGYSLHDKKSVLDFGELSEVARKSSGETTVDLGEGIAGGIQIGRDNLGASIGIGLGFAYSSFSGEKSLFATNIKDMEKFEDAFENAEEYAESNNGIVRANYEMNGENQIKLSFVVEITDKNDKIQTKTFDAMTLNIDSEYNSIYTETVKN